MDNTDNNNNQIYPSQPFNPVQSQTPPAPITPDDIISRPNLPEDNEENEPVTEEVENEEKPEKSKKKLYIILGIVAGVIVLLVACLLIFKNMIFYSFAVNAIGNNDYEKAQTFISSASDDKSKVLADYIDVRVDFNKRYKKMRTDFDPEKDVERLQKWYDKTSKIIKKYDDLPDEIRSDIDAFNTRLGLITDCLGVYDNLRYDIIEMMNVFAEINRLVAVDAAGFKVNTFTVREENSKLQIWEAYCNNLTTFCSNIPNGSDIYLLNYLINETKSEISELRNQMQNILNEGYSEDDEITSSGSGQEVFPDVTNSNGDKLNFNDPESYEEYMYKDICLSLMNYLSEFCYA